MPAKSSFNLKTVAAAGLLSAALVGCGGGSDSTVATSSEPSTPTQTPTAPGAPTDPEPDNQTATGTQTPTDPYADAKKALADAQMAYESLPATATYAEKQQKQTDIETAANSLVTALQTGGASFSDVTKAMNVKNAANTKATNYGNIVTAENKLKEAQTALKNLPATATYADKEKKQADIKTAANTLATALEAGGASASEIQAANEIGSTASNQETIYNTIVTAENKLKEAQTALTNLSATATYEEKRNAQKAIQTAASNLAKAQEASGDSTVDANTIAMKAEEEVKSLNNIIEAVNKVEAKYQLAKSLTEALDEKSSPAQIKAARDAVDDFRKEIASNPNLPKEEQTTYIAQVGTLTKDIDLIAGTPDGDPPNDVANWDKAIDNYRLSGNMADLPGGSGSSLVTTDSDIDFELNGRTLSGDRVRNLPSGWRGESYEDTRGDDLVDSGRVFTNNNAVDVDVTFRNIITDYNNIRGKFMSESTVAISPIDNDATTTVDGNITMSAPASGSWVNTGISRHSFKGASADRSLTGTGLPTGNNELTISATDNYRMFLFGVDMTVSSDNGGIIMKFNDDDELEVKIGGGTSDATLTFSPKATDGDPTNSNITADIADKKFTTKQFQVAYAEFGYWSEVTPNSPFVSIDTFARIMDNDLGLATQPGELKGDADYEGLAAGYYIIDMDDKLNNGEFTARVKLEADFDSSEISGDIDRFRSVTDTDHNSNLRNWSLTLNDAGFGRDNRNLDDVFDGTTDGGGPVDGEWQGQFAGNIGLHTTTLEDDHPQVVVGEFIGHFSDTDSAVGAFGAEID